MLMMIGMKIVNFLMIIIIRILEIYKETKHNDECNVDTAAAADDDDDDDDDDNNDDDDDDEIIIWALDLYKRKFTMMMDL